MSQTPTQQGGSARHEEPQADPNQQVDNPENPEANSQSDDEYRVDRMSVIDRIAAQADEDRAIAQGTRQEDMPAGEPVPSHEDPADEGLQSREQMHPEDQEDPNALPEEYANDPLAEFIVMEGDEPMFRTVVHGREELIPLEKARAQLQKHEAADRRLQEAAERDRKSEERERALQQREAEIEQRSRQLAGKDSPAPSATDVPDDEALVKEAREVVQGFFTGSEDEAAEKLVQFIKHNRGAVQQATSVDVDELERRAVAAARRELTEAELERDAKKGYKRFVEDYPDIAADDNLFRFADSMTDAIAEEHPDWMPSEVMLEAGKRVREWVDSQKAPEQSAPTDDRQQRQDRKRNLRPLPQPRSATPPKEPEEPAPETPYDAISEIRKARGQVT